jgi:Fe-S cluster assembly protein SufD
MSSTHSDTPKREQSLLSTLQHEGLKRYDKESLPNKHEENWRYTKPETLKLGDFISKIALRETDVNISQPYHEVILSLFQGTLKENHAQQLPPHQLPSHNALPSKVTLTKATEITESADPAPFLELFRKYTNYPHYYKSLNEAHCASLSSAYILTIPKHTSINETLLIRHLYHAINQSESSSYNTHIIVDLQEGASLSMVEMIDAPSDILFFPKITFLIGKNANLNFVSVQDLPRLSKNLSVHSFFLSEQATLGYAQVTLGAKVSRNDVYCELNGVKANADLYLLSALDKNQHNDFHGSQMHSAPGARSNLYCKNALKDKSRGVYFGVIDVAENAQKTDAYQTNRNFLLSKEARVDSIPNLAIRANDVKCSHGASTGQVNEEELFYLRSRGLKKEEAERLLVTGFFGDIIAKIPIESVKEEIAQMVLAKV